MFFSLLLFFPDMYFLMIVPLDTMSRFIGIWVETSISITGEFSSLWPQKGVASLLFLCEVFSFLGKVATKLPHSSSQTAFMNIFHLCDHVAQYSKHSLLILFLCRLIHMILRYRCGKVIRS